ncbi:MAG: hypothetical protein GXX96_15405 [Planctomycetaceae bacterium]|nr:hypothetical protein [Planctomycetaceae bacterium]
MTTLTAPEFNHILEELENTITITPGRVSRCSRGGVFLMVGPLTVPAHADRHLVTLGWGVPPKLAVQDLPCAMLTAENRILSVHRTDSRGQFEFDAEQLSGVIHFHFIPDVRSQLDVDILLQLADEEAIEFLEDRLCDDEVSVELKAYIARRLSTTSSALQEAFQTTGPLEGTPPNILAGAPSGGVSEWCYVPVADGMGGQPLADLEPARDFAPVDLDGDMLVINVPADKVPYGVVRVSANAKGDQAPLGSCLLPIGEYGPPGHTVRATQCNVRPLIGERRPADVEYHVQPANRETIAAGAFPAAEVEALLQHPDVQQFAGLKTDIERLSKELFSLFHEVTFALAARKERHAVAEFHSHAIHATFWETPSDILTLEVEVAAGSAPDRLARFTIWSQDRNTQLAQGFIGLRQESAVSKWAGEISLDAFDATLREKIGKSCYLGVEVCSLGDLTSDDQEQLERSKESCIGSLSAKRLLGEALKRLPARG